MTITLAAWGAAEPALGGLGLDDAMRRARASSADLAASDAAMAALPAVQATHGQRVAPFAGPFGSRAAVAPWQPLVALDG